MTRIILLLALGVPVLLAQPPVTVQWPETPQLFAGRTAVVWLNTGKKVEGEWLSVTDDSFAMLVRNKRATFQRADLRDAGYRNRRVRGRVWGTIGGLYVTGLAFAYAGAPEAAFPAALIGGVVGHYAGRALDRSIVRVAIE